MSEIRPLLPTIKKRDTLSPVEIVLSDAERAVVLSMRDLQTQPHLRILIVQFLGNAWRVHQTTASQYVK